MHTHHAPTSTAGLLLSLQAALPAQAPLARRARAIAPRLAIRHTRALEDRAAALLAELLDATDCTEAADYAEDGLLDPGFDD